MPLSLYLDDCADDDTLIAFLRRAGHEVNTPRLAGTAGASDGEQLDYAARNRQTLLTKTPLTYSNSIGIGKPRIARIQGSCSFTKRKK